MSQKRSNAYISKVLGPISMKLAEYLQVNPRIGYDGNFFLNFGRSSSRTKKWSNAYISEVFGPISIKLGKHMQVKPRIG